MTPLEDVVLTAIEEDLLAPEVIDAAIAQALETLDAQNGADDSGARVVREVASLDRELERLTNLAAAGGPDIPSVLEALRTRQERRRSLLVQQPTPLPQRARVRSRRDVGAALRARLTDLRGLLRRNVAEARPVLEMLLAVRIAVTPRADMTAPIFDVRIPLTTRGIFEGICCPNAMASPNGTDPQWTTAFHRRFRAA